MPLDIVRSVVFMAFAAAGVSGHHGTPGRLTDELKALLESGVGPEEGAELGFFPKYNRECEGELQLIGGDWSVAWGPVAALPPGVERADYVANAMYVAHSPSQNTYVVAVAGTAHHSFYDWAIEDAGVAWLETVRWSKWVPGAPHDALISGGTDDGLTNLLRMRAPDRTAPAAHRPAQVSLRDFMRSVDANSRVIVTGHSLGGALSPPLALLLLADREDGDATEVRVLPLAGPTPGNAAFATHFTTKFPHADEPLGCGPPWNRDVQNHYDLVPRAWNDLQSVLPRPDAAESAAGLHPSVWGYMTGEVAFCLQAFIDLLKVLALGVSYTSLHPMGFNDTFGEFGSPDSIDRSGPIDPLEPMDSPGFSTSTSPPEWTDWSEAPMQDPISSVGELSRLILASHYDQYIRHFGLVPFPSKKAKHPEADELMRLKKAARVAAARLTTAGSPPSSAGP